MQRAAVLLLLLPILLGALFGPYLLKSAVGIDLVPGEHLHDLISF